MSVRASISSSPRGSAPSASDRSLVAKYSPVAIDELCASADFLECVRALIDIDLLNILCVGHECSGKTTVINAIIRAYYDIPKEESISSKNILVINSLNDNGVAYFRSEVKAFCKSKSTIPSRKKTVVLDNLDTMSESVQHVFRGYIDKYSCNVNILASCVNSMKVAESVRSRLGILNVVAPNRDQVAQIMSRVVAGEGLDIGVDLQHSILAQCNYEACQVLNYLDKLKIIGLPVSADLCRISGADISTSEFDAYFEFVLARKLSEATAVLYAVHDNGYSVIDILEYMFAFVKITDALSERGKYSSVEIICKHIAIFNTVHESAVELAVMTNSMILAINPICV